MSDQPKKLDTDELTHALQSASSYDAVMDSCKNSIDNPTLGAYLRRLIHHAGYKPADIIQKTNLSKSFLYQILKGMRVPSRDILIRIAFAAGLGLDDTQRLLALAKRGKLYPKIRRDAAIIFCLNKRRSLEEVNELLESEYEVPLLRGEDLE